MNHVPFAFGHDPGRPQFTFGAIQQQPQMISHQSCGQQMNNGFYAFPSIAPTFRDQIHNVQIDEEDRQHLHELFQQVDYLVQFEESKQCHSENLILDALNNGFGLQQKSNQKQYQINQAIDLLEVHINNVLNIIKTQQLFSKRQILLELYQKMAILCYDHEQYQRIYTQLNQLIYCENIYFQNQGFGGLDQHLAIALDFRKDMTLLLILAQIEYKLGNSQRCNELCDALIAQDNTKIEALEMKGDICKHFCQIDQAFFYYSKAIEQNNDVSRAHSKVGDLYEHQGKMKEAIQHYETALIREIEKNYGKINISQIDFQNTPQISKIYTETFVKLFSTKNSSCDWRDYFEFTNHLKQIVLKQFQNGQMPCVDPFQLFMIDFTMDEKLVISAKWAQNERNKAYEAMKKVGINYFEPFQHQVLENSFFKIRIGYVSYDFADHPLAHLLNSLFKLHDRSKFQVVGFSLRPDDKSSWRQNIAKTCDEFYQIEQGVSALDLAKFIKSKNIHILFNLNGWTAGARQDAFALRPAPIQIQFMGFCGTTGADYIDYLVTDEVASPQHIVDKFYSEKAIYMPNSYFLNDYMQTSKYVFDPFEMRPQRKHYGLPEDKFIFANLNQLYKIDPLSFKVWMDILKQVPNSVLWILEYPKDAKENLQREALENGVDPSRIIMTPKAPKHEHINRCYIADLALDNPMTNGHTTSTDLLWSGLPMITFPLTDNMPSRVATSICSALGIGQEAVCLSYAEYQKRAKSYALGGLEDLSPEELTLYNHLDERLKRSHGSPKLKLFRHKIEQNRIKAPLFQTEPWVRQLEMGLKEAYKMYSQQDKKIDHIYVKNQIPALEGIRIIDQNI